MGINSLHKRMKQHEPVGKWCMATGRPNSSHELFVLPDDKDHEEEFLQYRTPVNS
jgi:hypothetical protein